MMATAAASRLGRVSAAVARRRMGGGPTQTHIVMGDLQKGIQDMPPPGGYPDVVFKRATIERGPEYWKIWAGAALMVGFGFYRVGQGNLERNAAKKEKREARMMIVPYLQAEEDARAVAASADRDAAEAKVMKGVTGWTVGESVYSSAKYWDAPAPLKHPRAGV